MNRVAITSILSGLFLLTLIPTSVHAQYRIRTVAGTGTGDGGSATNAELLNPVGVTTDNAGNIYIADASGYSVRKVDPTGIVTTIAGTGVYGSGGDGGPATAATLGQVYGLALDKTGNLYVVDNSNNCVRKINTSGIISTVAGTGVNGYTGDHGPATAATLNGPIDAVVDTNGNLYITDWYNRVVRKVNTAGIISTAVGNGSIGTSGSGGPATACQLGAPFRITKDNKGNLYIAEVQEQFICKVDTGGIITVIGGTGGYGTGSDGDGGAATSAIMTSPCGIAVDTSGNLYFSDINNSRIRKIDLNTGIISNYAANSTPGYSGDGGLAVSAEISYPEALACDVNGNLLICDAGNNLLRKVTKTTNIISTVAGHTGLFDDGIAAIDAQLNEPANIATDAAGNVYIADYSNNRVRKIDAASGIISTVAGDGLPTYTTLGDGGPATAGTLSSPMAVALDDAGNIYIAEPGNSRVRKVNTSGIITTVAGNGTYAYGGDGGAATLAKLNAPLGVAVDHKGNIYIADEGNSRIRMVNAVGVMSTFAGSATAGYSGDGSIAIAAKLQNPDGVLVDGIGNVYIADGGNNCVRKVDTFGIITTVAGTGSATGGFSGDGGPAIAAELNEPVGLIIDNIGNLYIADANNNRIRMVDTTGKISTIAGNGIAGFSGDGGFATSAKMNSPLGIGFGTGGAGTIYLSDAGNNRIRLLEAVAAVPGLDKTSGLSVYPNPARDQVTVETISASVTGTQLSLLDITGRVIYSMPMLGKTQTIDMKQLASGTYIVQVSDNTGVKKNVKVVKE